MMIPLIVVICTSLLCASQAAPLGQVKVTSDLMCHPLQLISGIAAAQEKELTPKERKERDKILCDLMNRVYKLVFQADIPIEDYCEAFREYEKPEEKNQKELYDFIFKQLKKLHIWKTTKTY